MNVRPIGAAAIFGILLLLLLRTFIAAYAAADHA
jgi:hypothetical protein